MQYKDRTYSILSSFQEEWKTPASIKALLKEKGIVIGPGLDFEIPDELANETDLPPAIEIARDQQNYFQYHEKEINHRLKRDLTVPPNEMVRMNYSHVH